MYCRSLKSYGSVKYNLRKLKDLEVIRKNEKDCILATFPREEEVKKNAEVLKSLNKELSLEASMIHGLYPYLFHLYLHPPLLPIGALTIELKRH